MSHGLQIRVLFTFLSFGGHSALANLEGEIMTFPELNHGVDLKDMKTFECLDGQDCQVGNSNREPTCVERRQMIGLAFNSTDKYVTVTVDPGREVQLECHYCHESDKLIPKIWFYYEKFLASKQYREVPLHLEYPEHARRFVVGADHRLTIKNFTEADGALYFCQGLDDDKSPKFNYLVDSMGDSSEMEPKRGNWEEFSKYRTDAVIPLNNKLKDEYKNDLKKWFGTKKSIHNYNIYHSWSQWSKCHSCGRENGLRMRTGTCQLNIPTLTYFGRNSNKKSFRGAMNFGYKFSCHSAMLKRFLTSKLRKKVQSLADFIEELPCDGLCSLAGLSSAETSELLASAHGSDGKDGKVDAVTIIVTLGEPLTLHCADNSKSDVVWLKNNAMLTLPDVSGSRSKVTISYTQNRGGVYFSSVNNSDEGNYTCILDDSVSKIFKLDIQEPVTESPIPETWIWIHMIIFSIGCFLIWLILVIYTSRVAIRIQQSYQPLSTEEEQFLKMKHNLMEGQDMSGSMDI